MAKYSVKKSDDYHSDLLLDTQTQQEYSMKKACELINELEWKIEALNARRKALENRPYFEWESVNDFRERKNYINGVNKGMCYIIYYGMAHLAFYDENDTKDFWYDLHSSCRFDDEHITLVSALPEPTIPESLDFIDGQPEVRR